MSIVLEPSLAGVLVMLHAASSVARNILRQSTIVLWTCLAPASIASGTANAFVEAADRIEIAPDSTAIAIDGRIDPDEWQEAARIPVWSEAVSGRAERATLWVSADRASLRIALRIPVADPGALLTRANARPGRDTLAPLDDSVEIWLSPAGPQSLPSGVRIVFNARGAIWDSRLQERDGIWQEDAAASTGVRVAALVTDRFWETELRIPRRVFGSNAGEARDRFSVRMIRQHRLPAMRRPWPAASRASNPFEPGLLVAVDDQAVVAVLSESELRVANRAATPVDLRIEATPTAACRGLGGRALRMDGNAHEVVRIEPDCVGDSDAIAIVESGTRSTRVRVSTGDASNGLPLGGSTSDPETARRAVRMDIGYYPTASSLRLRLDASGARPAFPDQSVRVRVESLASGERVLEASDARFADGQLSERLRLPRLEEGQYRVRAEIASPATGPVVVERVFRHADFEWEGNRIGLEPEVIPPFEPLVRTGRTIRAVLRAHRVGDVALFDQIDSVGLPILAAPIRFEVEVAGSTPPITVVDPVRFMSETPGQIGYASSWRAGALTAGLEARIEVDGFAWFEVVLPRQPGVRLERLDLVIPLRSEVARLMNAVTDLTRHNPSGELPAGRGRIWSSAETPRVEIPGSLVPYVWLGNDERGLALIAPGTRDWSVDPDAPIQTIERAAKAVELRMRLVGRPIDLDSERRLSFGLQATPTKPQALDPHWRRWQPRCAPAEFVKSLCILGASWVWGGATPHGDLYPAKGNEGIYAALADARRTGRFPSHAVSDWLSRRQTDHPRAEAERRSLDFGFRMMAAQPDAIVAYVNAHGVAPIDEFEIYRDEWSPTPFSDRDRAPLTLDELHVTFPTRSWQDFALWHLRDLVVSGAVDGFYFDNTFLRAVYDDLSGPAHRDADGKLQPAADLLELREFLRRAQTLAYQLRGRWFNVSHMTNTPIAPIQTWSAAILDGELRFGAEYFAERFSRDWLRAEAVGSQVGSLPLFLPGILRGQYAERGAAALDRLEMSSVAGAAVHEIRVWGGSTRLARRIWDPLYRFGYGQEDARVYRYWDTEPPFKISGADAEGLLIARDRRALALVTNFGGGARATLSLDGEALGLAAAGRCSDFLGEGSVETIGPFRCRFRIPEHGFRLVLWSED